MSDQPAFDSSRVPVVIGVGELADRPENVLNALDPAGLMVAALQRATDDAGGSDLLARLDRIDIINEISWPYPDPEAELRARLNRPDLETYYWPVGGQTPITALHKAAIDIQAGRASLIAVCGGEAQNSVRRADKEQIVLPWPARDSCFRPLRGGDYQNATAQALELTSPVNVYPLYENASRVAWGQTFEAAQKESARIWAHNSRIAARRNTAWLGTEVEPKTILSSEGGNRLIAWPYRKLMVANPIVNQGAAFIVSSLAVALEMKIPRKRLVFVHGGAAADEPRDILARRDYCRSQAMEGVLNYTAKLADGHVATELYSCFPCVPKMARRVLGLSDEDALSVTGGLTFFGAPLNNFMGHAIVAMVQQLRARTRWGLLYGQGEYVTKHHAVILGMEMPKQAMEEDYRLHDVEHAASSGAPLLDQSYRGSVKLETYTVLFDREQEWRHAVVIGRTPDGCRIASRVEASDRGTIERLTHSVEPVGSRGEIVGSAHEFPRWKFI